MRKRQTEWGVERGRKGGGEGETDGVRGRGDEVETDGVGGGEVEKRRK